MSCNSSSASCQSLASAKGKCRPICALEYSGRLQSISATQFTTRPLPDIASFATVGYPYTRKADLSETVIVVPQSLAEDEASAYLNVMALMGEATGDPATRVSVTRPRRSGCFRYSGCVDGRRMAWDRGAESFNGTAVGLSFTKAISFV